MRRAIYLCLFILTTLQNYGQSSLKSYVQENAIKINTIDPQSNDYSDLEMIAEAIGDKRIVMLGEQDHGDAPVYLAKTRLIKYLHEKKGFKILAFEADFFALNDGWNDVIKNKSEIEKFIRQNIYPVWTYCGTANHLFYDYIPSSYAIKTPVLIAGIDNQIYFSPYVLSAKLDSVLKQLNLPIIQDPEYALAIKPKIDSLLNVKTGMSQSEEFYQRCDNYLKIIRRQAGEKLNDNSFWLMVIDNLLQLNLQYLLKKDKPKSNNIRDHQMAQNLRWLAQVKYPNEKIIVWAANEHIAMYADTSESGYSRIAMGSYFTSDSNLKKQTYILGFTSHSGTAGRLGRKTYKIREPKKNGFENWINQDYQYSFVDFEAYHKNYTAESDEFYMKALGHQTFFRRDWTKIFNGIFYIKEMYSCITN